jgi:hypothetical protein
MNCATLTHIEADEVDEENVDKVLTGLLTTTALLETMDVNACIQCPVKKNTKRQSPINFRAPSNLSQIMIIG